jgi:pumilio family protein 6
MFKTLLQGGHFSREKQSVTLVPTFSAVAFASAFMKQVGQDLTLKMATGNGAFIVAELCERIRTEGAAEERATLRSWFKAIETIKRCDAKGKSVLLESISKLGK